MKRYENRIFVLNDDGSAWRPAGTLPVELAYGSSVTSGQTISFTGGYNAEGVKDGVWAVEALNGQVTARRIGKLPAPVAMHASGIHRGRLYILGGQGEPLSREALGNI